MPVYVDLEWDAHDANKRLSLIQLTTGRAHEDRPVLVFDAIEIAGAASCGTAHCPRPAPLELEAPSSAGS